LFPVTRRSKKGLASSSALPLPYRLIFAGNLALAVPQPGHSNLPLVLRRRNDQFVVCDEAKAWTYFHRFEDNVQFFRESTPTNPFLSALRAMHSPNMDYAIYGGHVSTPLLPAYPFSLAAAIRAQEEKIRDVPRDAAKHRGAW